MTFFEILMSLSVSLIQSPNNSSKSAINLVDKGLYAKMNGWRIDPLRNIHRWCFFLSFLFILSKIEVSFLFILSKIEVLFLFILSKSCIFARRSAVFLQRFE